MVDGIIDGIVDEVVTYVMDISKFDIELPDFGLDLTDLKAGKAKLPDFAVKHSDFVSKLGEPGYGTGMFQESAEYTDNLLNAQKFQIISMAGNASFDSSIFDEDFRVPDGMSKAVVKEEVMFSANKAVAYHAGMDAMIAQERAVSLFGRTREQFYEDAIAESTAEYIALEKQKATLQRMVNYGSPII